MGVVEGGSRGDTLPWSQPDLGSNLSSARPNAVMLGTDWMAPSLLLR